MSKLITQVKKMYTSDFDSFLRQELGDSFFDDFKGHYYYDKIYRAILNSDEIFIRKKNDQNKPKYRITFPLFLIFIIAAYLYAMFKWLFTGSFNLNHKSRFTKFMISWDRICKFKILN